MVHITHMWVKRTRKVNLKHADKWNPEKRKPQPHLSIHSFTHSQSKHSLTMYYVSVPGLVWGVIRTTQGPMSATGRQTLEHPVSMEPPDGPNM